MIQGLPEEELFVAGNNACAGCGPATVLRHAIRAAGKNTIVVGATGCMEVVSTLYPYTSWKVPYIHGAFENAAAIASGIDKALESLNKREKVNILVIGGDGSTFDIGFQAISGAIERQHKFCYICYDNGAYMNTGIQTSGATPTYAATTTSPSGKVIHGKQGPKKNMPLIVAAHGDFVYVATANMAYIQDFINKVKKGLAHNGPSYIQIFSPCPTGWNYPTHQTVEIARLAFQSKITPIYEIENGKLKFNMKPQKPIPVEKYLLLQKRFKHMNKNEIKEVQKEVNESFKKLENLERCKSIF